MRYCTRAFGLSVSLEKPSESIQIWLPCHIYVFLSYRSSISSMEAVTPCFSHLVWIRKRQICTICPPLFLKQTIYTALHQHQEPKESVDHLLSNSNLDLSQWFQLLPWYLQCLLWTHHLQHPFQPSSWSLLVMWLARVEVGPGTPPFLPPFSWRWSANPNLPRDHFQSWQRSPARWQNAIRFTWLWECELHNLNPISTNFPTTSEMHSSSIQHWNL